MSLERLHKYLAGAGWGSRRHLEQAIAAGQIKVNGKPAEVGQKVVEGDRIQWGARHVTVDGSAVERVKVLAYHKPEGEICTRADPEGRPTVFDRLPTLRDGRWVAIGRLDINTSGLLLFTNRGDLANNLMHPSTGIEREYLVRVQGDVTEEMLDHLQGGVVLDDGIAKFDKVVQKRDQSGTNSWFFCVLKEGRNREVRRLWESQGVRVNRLKRVRYGPLALPAYLTQAHWQELEEYDIKLLFQAANMTLPPLPRPSNNVVERRNRQVKRLRSKGRARKPV